MSGSEATQLAGQLSTNWLDADLRAADKAILEYSAKLTLTPGSIAEDDVERLRMHGLNDRAIHDLACIVGYFAFVNRVADGLGVELEA
jgi:uncharacterized peroxidase-related enzyme